MTTNNDPIVQKADKDTRSYEERYRAMLKKYQQRTEDWCKVLEQAQSFASKNDELRSTLEAVREKIEIIDRNHATEECPCWICDKCNEALTLINEKLGGGE